MTETDRRYDAIIAADRRRATQDLLDRLGWLEASLARAEQRAERWRRAVEHRESQLSSVRIALRSRGIVVPR